MEEVPPFQPQVYTYVCDVGKRESVYSTAEKVRREVGEVDILINNAGVVSGHHLLECPDELIERTMVVNCHAHFWVSFMHEGGRSLPTSKKRVRLRETRVARGYRILDLQYDALIISASVSMSTVLSDVFTLMAGSQECFQSVLHAYS